MSYDDPTPAIYREKWVRGRKDYRCYECHNPIPRGRHHQVASGLWEDEWRTFRTCWTCLDLRVHIQAQLQYSEDWPGFGELYEHAQESDLLCVVRSP